MATFTSTITYPDAKQVDLIDTLSTALGYQATISDGQGGTIANPETKAQFIQRKANEHMKEWISNVYRGEKDRAYLVTNSNDLWAS